MGAQCVRSSPKMTAKYPDQRLDQLGNELRQCQEDLHFTLTIEHLRLTNMTEKVKEIKFSLENQFTILYSLSQFSIQENIIKSEKIHKTQFKIPAYKVESRKLRIQIIDFKDKVIEVVKLKLHQLITGPLHHDHLLQELKSRLMFDLNIYQTIELTATCSNFKIDFPQRNQEILETFAYQFILTTQSDEKTVISQLGFFQKTHFQCQVIKMTLPHNHLKSSNFRFQIIKNYNSFSQSKIYQTFFIPYSKVLLQADHSILKIEGFERHKRTFHYSQSIQHEKTRGTLKFDLQLINSNLYVQQMEGFIMSQIGVTTISPQTMIDQKQTDTILNELEQAYKTLKSFRSNELTREKKIETFKILEVICNKLKILKDQNYIDEIDLYKKQIILLKLLNQFSKIFTEGQDFLNQKLWHIISVVIHRNDLSVKYFHVYKDQSKKKQAILRYYRFICEVLKKIIISTNTGITFNELLCIQKFIAFAYFRFPWIQNKVLSVICNENDPLISQQKLLQFGASVSCKSPSKSFVYDWQKNIYNFIKNQKDYKEMFSNLQEVSSQVNEWPNLLFNRKDDDLYYGLYFELWNQAELTLKNYHGKIMWEFFPNYGKLLSSFLGEMNNSKISDFSLSFKNCSSKLILNEKLLNTFVMLLFPKTYLYEASCVLKCLSFLQSYFEVLTTQNKKLPHDFHFNYFYTGIKSIFEQNHSYLIVKTLLILHKHYKIFTNDFKKTLNAYIFNNNVFVHLFLHWCSNVRKMFHHFVHFVIFKNLNQNNPEELLESKENLSTKTSKTQAFHINKKLSLFLNLLKQTSQQLEKLQKQEAKLQKKNLHQKMKDKLGKKKQEKKFQTLFRQNSDFITSNHSCLNFQQSLLSRKKSLAEWSQQGSFLKQRRKWSMEQQDELITQHLEQKYKKYAKIGLKQFEQVKKSLNPQKQIQKLSNMFQGQIDS